MKSRILLSLVASASLLVSGCVHVDLSRSYTSTPLNEVVKVGEMTKDSLHAAEKAPLQLPAAVAIVVVPGKGDQAAVMGDATLRLAAERVKKQLLNNPKYVKAVSVVSGSDVRGKLTLEQISAMYGTDVAIILSHQQDQRSRQGGVAGLVDITILGTFLNPGVQTQTVTVVDGNVVHIPSNAVIFRASGTDERSTRSATYTERSTANEESIEGLLAAAGNFGTALTNEFNRFDSFDLSKAVPVSALTADPAEKPVVPEKGANDYWNKVDTYKRTGGGSLGAAGLLLCAAACYAARRRR